MGTDGWGIHEEQFGCWMRWPPIETTKGRGRSWKGKQILGGVRKAEHKLHRDAVTTVGGEVHEWLHLSSNRNVTGRCSTLRAFSVRKTLKKSAVQSSESREGGAGGWKERRLEAQGKTHQRNGNCSSGCLALVRT